jgi:hypothetical protein
LIDSLAVAVVVVSGPDSHRRVVLVAVLRVLPTAVMPASLRLPTPVVAAVVERQDVPWVETVARD